MRKISKLLGIVSLFLASGGVYGLLFENIDLVSILAVLVWIVIGYGFLWLAIYKRNNNIKAVVDIKVGGSNVIDLRKNG